MRSPRPHRKRAWFYTTWEHPHGRSGRCPGARHRSCVRLFYHQSAGLKTPGRRKPVPGTYRQDVADKRLLMNRRIAPISETDSAPPIPLLERPRERAHLAKANRNAIRCRSTSVLRVSSTSLSRSDAAAGYGYSYNTLAPHRPGHLPPRQPDTRPATSRLVGERLQTRSPPSAGFAIFNGTPPYRHSRLCNSLYNQALWCHRT